MFPFLCPIHFIAFSFHKVDKIFPTQALLHGFPDMVHQPELPALTFLRCAVLPGGKVLSTALVRFQHTQSMSLADLITELAKLFQSAWVLPQLLSVFIADGVDHKVGMDMGSVAVRGYQYLMPRPCLLCKLFCDLVSLYRCNGFSGGEGLDVLIKIHAVQLVIGRLGCFKLGDSVEAITVDAADQWLTRLFVPHLILSLTVSHYSTHSTEVLLSFRDIDDRCHITHHDRCGGFPRRLLAATQ